MKFYDRKKRFTSGSVVLMSSKWKYIFFMYRIYKFHYASCLIIVIIKKNYMARGLTSRPTKKKKWYNHVCNTKMSIQWNVHWQFNRYQPVNNNRRIFYQTNVEKLQIFVFLRKIT